MAKIGDKFLSKLTFFIDFQVVLEVILELEQVGQILTITSHTLSMEIQGIKNAFRDK